MRREDQFSRTGSPCQRYGNRDEVRPPVGRRRPGVEVALVEVEVVEELQTGDPLDLTDRESQRRGRAQHPVPLEVAPLPCLSRGEPLGGDRDHVAVQAAAPLGHGGVGCPSSGGPAQHEPLGHGHRCAGRSGRRRNESREPLGDHHVEGQTAPAQCGHRLDHLLLTGDGVIALDEQHIDVARYIVGVQVQRIGVTDHDAYPVSVPPHPAARLRRRPRVGLDRQDRRRAGLGGQHGQHGQRAGPDLQYGLSGYQVLDVVPVRRHPGPVADHHLVKSPVESRRPQIRRGVVLEVGGLVVDRIPTPGHVQPVESVAE